MAARGNKYKSFMLSRFLIIPFHKSYTSQSHGYQSGSDINRKLS